MKNVCDGTSILIDLEDVLEDEGVVPPSDKGWVLFIITVRSKELGVPLPGDME